MRTTLVTLLALLTLPACVAMTEEELARWRGAERIPIDTSRVWTYPVTFHGAQVSFEMLPDEKPEFQMPTPQMDLIGVHGTPRRAIGFGYHRFHIQGRTHERHEDASFYLHRAPAAGEEWRLDGPPLTIVWQGNGSAFPVAEFYPDEASASRERSSDRHRRRHVIWTIAGTSIHHRPNGTVEVKRARDVRTLYAPSTIRLGPGGEILALE